MVNKLIAIAALAILSLTACGKKAEEAPKTAEQLQVERDKTAKTVRENPVYGDQVKALDKAKATADAAGEAKKKTDDALKEENPITKGY